MTTALLIRHGETDAVGKLLAGWIPGWHLNTRGKRQAERLAERLAHIPISAIYSSPLERTIETAEHIARLHGLPVRPVADLGEVRQGAWEGKSFAELKNDDDWKQYNSVRTMGHAPGGELAAETQARMVRALDCLAARHVGETIVMVSHGDPLRYLLAWCLGIPMDLALRFDIGTGSLSVLQVADGGPHVLSINEFGDAHV